MIQYGVKVSKFPYSPHFYGRAWCYSNDDSILFDEELQRILNQEDANLLNTYDPDVPDQWPGYQDGDRCVRFETYATVLSEGIRVLHEKYGNSITIEMGEYWNVNNPRAEEIVEDQKKSS